MLGFVRSHPLVAALVLLFVVAGVTAIVSGQNQTPDWVTTTVERGVVQEVVSVSGTVEATQAAELAFPASGRIADILVRRGDTVTAGDTLALLGDTTLAAERAQAVATLAEARASQAELQAGQTIEERAVTDTTTNNAVEALERSQSLAIESVENALRELLSIDLEALALNSGTNAPAPVVSGNYTCTDEGIYRLTVYSSGSESGYSYRLSGLENGTYTAFTDQPAALGRCGLFLQFSDDEIYTNTEWEISVPNTRSATYITRRNTYTTTLTQAEQNVAAARDAVRLAEDQASQATAGARVESLIAANARVEQAVARVQTIDAQLQDYAITAPFDSIVTHVAPEIGETVQNEAVITLLNTKTFELEARIPEIDITRLAVGQRISATFDANPTEVVSGTITYLAPDAEEIDGVGYFTAVITLEPSPDWLRAGFNADVDIIVNEQTDVVRIPQRFLISDGTTFVVRQLQNDTVATTGVELLLRGNNGYVAVSGLSVDDVVVAP